MTFVHLRNRTFALVNETGKIRTMFVYNRERKIELPKRFVDSGMRNWSYLRKFAPSLAVRFSTAVNMYGSLTF